MVRQFLDTPIEFLKGVGPARAELLKKELGIYSFYDLLYFFPFRYIDRSKIWKIIDIDNDQSYVQLRGKISNIQEVGHGKASRLTAWVTDDTAAMELVWFQGHKWIKEALRPGVEYIVFGKPSWFNNRLNLAHPELEPASEYEKSLQVNLQGIYSTTEKLKTRGLGTRSFVKLIKALIPQVKGKIPESLPAYILERLKLLNKEDSLVNLHFPENPQLLQKAEARMKFEELFYIQLKILKDKLDRQTHIKGYNFSKVGDFTNRFYKENLPFELTGAQKKVIREIRHDLGSGHQMNRLLQGDVGSGKTLVALMILLIALDNDFQGCIMAPTEILANQHYNTISRMIDGLGAEVALLTGSTPVSKRKPILSKLEDGSLHILIGTHALIEDVVQFHNLGLVVIDEQHRFGVEQRAKLWLKSATPPHILVMTATPIPRTLAMTFYGDLDLSVIDELPPGRKPVKTFHYNESARLKVFGFIRQKIKEGRQIYIVYPLINESVKLDMKALIEGYDAIVRDFPLPEYAVSIVHGQMRSADKEYEMQRFIRKETQIMVATSVIEVGVDVANASVMIIENAERFGLSQLHQLRGRVGRGADQSYCILMTGDKVGDDAMERIKTMVMTTDGFEIAETDLRLRGPGDLQGTMQSGMIELKLANLVRDEKILNYARSLANEILGEDPHLSSDKNKVLKDNLEKSERDFIDWSVVS